MMSSDSGVNLKAMLRVKRAGIATFFGALLLPTLIACGPGSTPARSAVSGTTLRFFEHDTQQTALDLGDRGTSSGDAHIFSGDLFDHPGGTNVGRIGGQCITIIANATDPGELFCNGILVFNRGQITIQGLFDGAAFFGGRNVVFSITGGTGTYRDAHGDGTVQLPPDVPHRTNANFVLRLGTG
jgi:hypothetical protein